MSEPHGLFQPIDVPPEVVDRVWARIQAKLEAQPTAEPYTAYDRGDLCADIDRAIGDQIERTIHRYIPRDLAKAARGGIVKQIADMVIVYDQSAGGSNESA